MHLLSYYKTLVVLYFFFKSERREEIPGNLIDSSIDFLEYFTINNSFEVLPYHLAKSILIFSLKKFQIFILQNWVIFSDGSETQNWIFEYMDLAEKWVTT